MKVGYPCINRSIGCSASKTFRLASYSEERLRETIKNNLSCLMKILESNVEKDLLFFRISSETIPFASHPICSVNWKEEFEKELIEVGTFIKKHDIRISMHPDQFVLINAEKEEIVDKSIADLAWHCKLLDAMGLDKTAKIQIHVGGVYGDKEAAIERFVQRYRALPQFIRARLVIENDDRLFSLNDCLMVHDMTGVPIVFDTLHHEILNEGETLSEAALSARKTWSEEDGALMVDYSDQEPSARTGKHRTSINEEHFRSVVEQIKDTQCDIMLEIKDKEPSALKAKAILEEVHETHDLP